MDYSSWMDIIRSWFHTLFEMKYSHVSLYCIWLHLCRIKTIEWFQKPPFEMKCSHIICVNIYMYEGCTPTHAYTNTQPSEHSHICSQPDFLLYCSANIEQPPSTHQKCKLFAFVQKVSQNSLVSDVICCIYSSIGFALFSTLILM